MYIRTCTLGNNYSNNNGKDRIPTIEDVPKLEYTEKVFKESMRLYPPAWTIGRQVISDYKGLLFLLLLRQNLLLLNQILKACSNHH